MKLKLNRSGLRKFDQKFSSILRLNFASICHSLEPLLEGKLICCRVYLRCATLTGNAIINFAYLQSALCRWSTIQVQFVSRRCCIRALVLCATLTTRIGKLLFTAFCIILSYFVGQSNKHKTKCSLCTRLSALKRNRVEPPSCVVSL